MKAALPLALSMLALAACAPAAKAPPISTAAPASRPALSAATAVPNRINSILPDNWMDLPDTPGTWRYERLAAGSAATFVGRDNAALARLACQPANRSIVLSLPEPAARSYAAEIRTETMTMTLPLSTPDGRPVISLPSNLSLLDAMALSKGKFAIGAEGMAPLTLPSWAEVSRVIEDCR